MTPIIQKLVKQLNLTPHPEGGFYREPYRSQGTIPASVLPSTFGGDRNYATDLFYLLPQGDCSCFHRIKSDEIWHFMLGGPMTLVEITPQGEVIKTILGQNLDRGESLQHVVPAGHWFGAHPNPGTEFSLVTCVVIPGFDFKDFEMADRETLLKQFPKAKEEILKLTK